MENPASYIAHDGNEYQWPPPVGWWQATDGRYYPPRQDQIRSRRRSWVPLVLAVGGFAIFAALGALAFVMLGEGDEQPVAVSPADARKQAAPSVTVETMSTTRPTSRATTTTAARVTMPNGEEPFDGYPVVVSIASLDYRVASWMEPATEAVALAPGVYVTYNPAVTDLDRYYDVGAYGDCIMIDTYFPASGGACWDGVLPGPEEPS